MHFWPFCPFNKLWDLKQILGSQNTDSVETTLSSIDTVGAIWNNNCEGFWGYPPISKGLIRVATHLSMWWWQCRVTMGIKRCLSGCGQWGRWGSEWGLTMRLKHEVSAAANTVMKCFNPKYFTRWARVIRTILKWFNPAYFTFWPYHLHFANTAMKWFNPTMYIMCCCASSDFPGVCTESNSMNSSDVLCFFFALSQLIGTVAAEVHHGQG